MVGNLGFQVLRVNGFLFHVHTNLQPPHIQIALRNRLPQKKYHKDGITVQYFVKDSLIILFGMMQPIIQHQTPKLIAVVAFCAVPGFSPRKSSLEQLARANAEAAKIKYFFISKNVYN